LVVAVAAGGGNKRGGGGVGGGWGAVMRRCANRRRASTHACADAGRSVCDRSDHWHLRHVYRVAARESGRPGVHRSLVGVSETHVSGTSCCCAPTADRPQPTRPSRVAGVVEDWEVKQVVAEKDAATLDATSARNTLVYVLMILAASVISNAVMMVRHFHAAGARAGDAADVSVTQ